MRTVRVYGFGRDNGSYGQVTSGFMEALVGYGYGYGVDKLDLVALDEDQTFEEEPKGLPLAEVALFTGPPTMCPRMTAGTKHDKRLVMVAPNSSKLPDRTMGIVNDHATHVMTPSKWGKTVVERYTKHEVLVVPHGVSKRFVRNGRSDKALEARKMSYDKGEFRVLHLSSSDGERKGTLELCKAFAMARAAGRIPLGAELRLLVTPNGKGRLLDEGVLDRHMTLANRVVSGLEPEAMAREYDAAHLVCQPSRGEGFGMVPLEALAVGTPVLATSATGHAEWFEGSGALHIPTGPDAPIDDMQGALAPSLRVEDIDMALGYAYEEWPDLVRHVQARARGLALSHSWEQALEPLTPLLGAP